MNGGYDLESPLSRRPDGGVIAGGQPSSWGIACREARPFASSTRFCSSPFGFLFDHPDIAKNCVDFDCFWFFVGSFRTAGQGLEKKTQRREGCDSSETAQSDTARCGRALAGQAFQHDAPAAFCEHPRGRREQLGLPDHGSDHVSPGLPMKLLAGPASFYRSGAQMRRATWRLARVFVDAGGNGRNPKILWVSGESAHKSIDDEVTRDAAVSGS